MLVSRTAAVIGLAFAVPLWVLVSAASVWAQEAPPTPGPDQIVITGLVPVPPGTEILLQVLTRDVAAEFLDCSSATSEPTADDAPDVSMYSVVLERACLDDHIGAVICWAERPNCDLVNVGPEDFGTTVESGLLMKIPTAEGPTLPQPGGGSDVTLPTVGAGGAMPELHHWSELTTAVAALAGGGLMTAGRLMSLRRGGQPAASRSGSAWHP